MKNAYTSTSCFSSLDPHVSHGFRALVFLGALSIGCVGGELETDDGSVFRDDADPVESAAFAIRTDTGFQWPLDRVESGDANFGSCGSAYYTGLRHNGADLSAIVTTRVYAVADGTVRAISGPAASSGWGEGNYGVAIEHRSSAGSFIAIYGHIRNLTVRVGSRVTRSTLIGQVGPYAGGNHLHFGIRPGTTVPSSGWGRISDPRCSNPTNLNGFVAPITYLKTNRPS